MPSNAHLLNELLGHGSVWPRLSRCSGAVRPDRP